MIQQLVRRTFATSGTLLLVSGLLFADVVSAQTFGRVKFVVTLADGEPVKDVRITATSEELGRFEKKIKTNKKGEALLSVIDATKRYQIVVEYEGFPPVKTEIKPQLGNTITHEVVLNRGTAPPSSSSGKAAGLTPAQVAFNDGVKAAQDDDYETATAKFLESIELDANLAAPHLALAGIYFDSKDFEAAVHHATRASEIQQDSLRAYRILYEAHTELGRKKEAKQAYDRLNELGEGADTAAVVYNEGVAAFRVGDNATAKANFEKALELQDDLMPAVSALALLYLRDGSFAEAAEMAERFLARTSDDPRMLRARWEAYRGLGDTAKEKVAFEALAAADPQVLVTEFFDDGAKAFDSDDIDTARDSFEKVLRIDPDHARAHYQLALCLVRTGETAGAREHFEKFIEIAPEDPETATAKEMLSFLDN